MQPQYDGLITMRNMCSRIGRLGTGPYLAYTITIIYCACVGLRNCQHHCGGFRSDYILCTADKIRGRTTIYELPHHTCIFRNGLYIPQPHSPAPRTHLHAVLAYECIYMYAG